MTTTQINFAKLQEDKRHNQVLESQGYSSIAENVRHNTANENIGWYTGASTVAANEARAHQANVEADNYWWNIVANSKRPEVVVAYLLEQGILNYGIPWVKDYIDDKTSTLSDGNSGSGDYYTNAGRQK